MQIEYHHLHSVNMAERKSYFNRKCKFNSTNDPFIFTVSSHGLLSTTSSGMFRAWTAYSRPRFSVVTLPGHSFGYPWQGFGREGCCTGGLCEMRPGPAPVLCQAEAIPATPNRSTRGTAEPCQPTCWAPRDHIVEERGGNTRQSEEEGTKSMRNS